MIPSVRIAAMKGTNRTIFNAPFVVLAVLSIECLSSGGRGEQKTEVKHDYQSALVLQSTDIARVSV